MNRAMNRTTKTGLYGLSSLLVLGLLSACGGGVFELDDNVARQMVDPVEEQPCTDNNPQRNAYFGDFHVHTGYSADAWKFGVRSTPRDAYSYAFGNEILLAPNQQDDITGTRAVKIDRPLDFIGVTDHAEFYAEGRLCTDPSYPQYDMPYCEKYREGYGRDFMQALALILPYTWREESICGDDGENCKAVSGTVWQDTIEAAEEWNDTSANCERTTFVAYEYSSVRLGSNLHRNVIFRNTIVPPVPVSTIEAPRHWQLWEALQKDCLESGTGCDVLAIPHNSNISNGRMFSVDYPGTDGVDEERARAALRMKVEPVVEIMQHKGDSECRNGVSQVLGEVDELCEFEAFENFAFETTSIFGGEPGDCSESWWSDSSLNLGPSCVSRLSYIRTTLTEGLKEEERIGVNPFKFGLSAATDTHNGLGGGVEERSFPGHLGLGDDTIEKRTAWSKEYAGNASNNPGGLIGVWSEENSRDAIFETLQRKEVFGTSGPRIKPRLFAGWNYAGNLCSDPRMLGKAYQHGVPMGGDLSGGDRPSENAVPSFVVAATADVGTDQYPGTPLQRLQIVKGWVDADGVSNQKVFDVAGDANNGASVDLDTCAQSGEGYAQLCTVWKDPEFDAGLRAVYYMRAVENPSCRYSTWQCNSLPADQRPEDCSDDRNRTPMQERAWTSPIWYTPNA